MEIRFTNKKLKEISLDEELLLVHARTNGIENPVSVVPKIKLALWHLASADTMYDMPEYFRPHPLVTDLKGHYGMNVTRSHRLVVKPDHADEPEFNWENIKSIRRVVVTHLCNDYHKNGRKKQ